MTRREIRKAAQAQVEAGLGRQAVYDQLSVQGTGLESEKLARIVRYVPSLAARQHYKVPHSILLVLLWLSAVGKSLFGLSIAMEQGWDRWYLALWLPAITIALSVAVAMYRTRAYNTLAVLASIGLLKYITRTDWAHFDPWNTIDLAVAGGIIGLSWYLFFKVASNYEVATAADGSKVITFPTEPIAGL